MSKLINDFSIANQLQDLVAEVLQGADVVKAYKTNR